MSMQDPISDMLTRIRNAQQRAKRDVSIPASSKKAAIAEVLKKEGYITDYRVEGDGPKKELIVELKYYEGKPVIERMQRVSRPGLRIYRGKNEIPSVALMGEEVTCSDDPPLLSTINDPEFSYQWKINGTDISDANAAQYTPTVSGTYSVEVTYDVSGVSVEADVLILRFTNYRL